MTNNDADNEIAYFFIPLIEPLAFPDGHVMSFVDQEPVESLMNRLRANEGDEHQLSYSLAWSFRFWKGVASMQDADLMGQLITIAHRAIPGLPELPTESLTMPTVDRTIVEMAVPMVSHSDDPLSDAFDKGIASLRNLQRAYHMVRKERLTLITRQRLPALIPFGIRRLSQDNDEWIHGLQVLAVNMNITAPTESELSPEEMKQLAVALHAQPGERVFTAYIDIARHAKNALNLDGDHRTAVMFTAIAAEAFLDDLLAHLLWEEGRRPEDATPIFDTGFQTRIRNQYHGRIGGAGWGLDRDGVPYNWNKHIAAVRHRVVHAGYEPTYAEAAQALETLFALETFVIDRLLVEQSLKRYPRTALMLMGEPGVRRRRKWSKRLDQLGSNPSEPDWVRTFIRWKAVMQQNRLEAPSETVPPTVEKAEVIVVFHPGGVRTWVLHDPATHMAHRASTPMTLNAAQSAAITTIQDSSANYPSVFSERMDIDAVHCPLLDGFTWVPAYRLLPFFGVMVNGTDLDPI